MSDPTMHHLDEAQRHAAAEGQLDGAEVTAVEEHLGNCAECRRDVERIRALLAEVEAMSRAIEPPADLWPGILERGRSARKPGAGRIQGIPRRPIVWLAAAAVLLIMASSAVTTLVIRSGDERTAARSADRPDSTASTEYRRVSAEYDRMDQELAATLAIHKEKLLPETIEKVERNLAIIDHAIGEIRQALAADPNNKALQQLLKASYGQKAALLRQVSQS